MNVNIVDITCEKFKNMIDKETVANNQATTGNLGIFLNEDRKRMRKGEIERLKARTYAYKMTTMHVQGKGGRKNVFKTHKRYKN